MCKYSDPLSSVGGRKSGHGMLGSTVLRKLHVWKEIGLYECGPIPPPHGPICLKALHFCALNVYTVLGRGGAVG